MTTKPVSSVRNPWRIVAPLAVVFVVSLLAYWFWSDRKTSHTAEAVRTAYIARDLELAAREVDRWIKLQPTSGEPWYWKARVELAREHPHVTIEALQKAHSLGVPEDRLKVITYIMQVFGGKFDQTEALLKEARDQSTEPDPELDQALARLYLSSFRFGLATTALEQWMKDAPNDPKPYLWRNEIEERTSTDIEPLIKNYREALKRDPSLIEARLGIADKLRTGRRAEEAAREYESYLKIKPDSVEANRGAGQVALELGKTDEAIPYFQKVLERNPKDAVSLRELALLDIRSRDYERAAQRLKLAIEVEPFDPDLHFNLSRALKLAGKTKESAEIAAVTDRLRKEQNYMNDLREKLVANPSDAKLRLEAARWLLDHGHDKEGLDWTELILKSNPGDQETCLLLADYYKAKKNFGLANFYRLAAKPTRSSP